MFPNGKMIKADKTRSCKVIDGVVFNKETRIPWFNNSPWNHFPEPFGLVSGD